MVFSIQVRSSISVMVLVAARSRMMSITVPCLIFTKKSATGIAPRALVWK